MQTNIFLIMIITIMVITPMILTYRNLKVCDFCYILQKEGIELPNYYKMVFMIWKPLDKKYWIKEEMKL